MPWTEILNALPVSAVVCAPVPGQGDARVVAMNAQAADLLGCAGEPVEGRTLVELLSPERAAGLSSLVDEVDEVGGGVETRVAGTDDASRLPPSIYRVRRLPDDLLLVVAEPIRDAAPQAECGPPRDLWDEAERLARLGSFELKLDTGSVSASAGWMAVHGTEVCPANLDELYPYAYFEDLPRIGAAFEGSFARGEEYDLQHRIVRRSDGEVRWVHARGRLGTGNAGHRVLRGVAQDITERHTAEQELREREAMFCRYFQADPLPTYLFEKRADELVLTELNRAAIEQVGASPERAVGQPISTLWTERSDLVDDAWRCLVEGRVVHRESEYTSFVTGRVGTYGFTFVPLSRAALMLHCEELTGRRAMEQRVRRRLQALTAPDSGSSARLEDLVDPHELETFLGQLETVTGLRVRFARARDDSEGGLQLAFDDGTDAIRSMLRLDLFGDAEGPVTLIEGGVARMRLPIAVRGRVLGRLVGFARHRGAELDLERWRRRALSRRMDPPALVSVIETLPECSEAQLEWAARTAHGMVTMMVELGYRNVEQAKIIAQRERAEVALRESEARYRGLFLKAPNGIVLLDGSTGEILDCNPAFLKLGGWCREEVVGSFGTELHASGEAWSSTFIEQVTERGIDSLESRVLTARGESRDVLVRLHRTRYEDHDVVIASYHDITDQKRFQSRSQEAQKLESLGVMAGGIAHHFNNLLAAVLGNAELALPDVDPRSEAAESLRQIRSSAERGHVLTDQILAYSGHRPLRPESNDLSSLVRNAHEVVRLGIPSGVRLEYELTDRLPNVRSDPAQIRQTVVNLIQNAAEATGGADGTVAIRTYGRRFSEADLSSEAVAQGARPGPFAVLEVEDRGHGMDPVTLRRAHEPFYTTRGFGRGLGLAAVLGIVRAHGGALEVESELGHGTVVRVLLPAAGSAGASVGGAKSTTRAIIIEDEDELRRVLGRLLEQSGYDVEAFPNGDAALESLGLPSQVAVALIDVSMPGRDGPSTVSALRAAGLEGPILLMSGRSDPATRDCGADGFLAKPFTMDALRRALGTLATGQAS